MGKLKTIIKEGVKDVADAYIEGKYNFDNPTPEIEQLAKERLKTCNGCLVREPIKFLRVEDERIPELSNKMCDECGCTAAYKFRQNSIKCKRWLN